MRLAVLGNRTKRREKEDTVMRSIFVATLRSKEKTTIACTLVPRTVEKRFL